MNQPSLLSDLGLDSLSPEDQALITEKITEAVLKRIVSSSIHMLSEEQLEEFSSLPDDASADEVEGFFRTNIPDYDAHVERVIREFKSDVLSELGESAN